MSRPTEHDNRSGPRYLATLEVKAEWDEPSGTHVVAEGTTENVGPEGTLVHLPRHLPDVGSRVRLEVLGELYALSLVVGRNPRAIHEIGRTICKSAVIEPADGLPMFEHKGHAIRTHFQDGFASACFAVPPETRVEEARVVDTKFAGSGVIGHHLSRQIRRHADFLTRR